MAVTGLRREMRVGAHHFRPSQWLLRGWVNIDSSLVVRILVEGICLQFQTTDLNMSGIVCQRTMRSFVRTGKINIWLVWFCHGKIIRKYWVVRFGWCSKRCPLPLMWKHVKETQLLFQPISPFSLIFLIDNLIYKLLYATRIKCLKALIWYHNLCMHTSGQICHKIENRLLNGQVSDQALFGLLMQIPLIIH